MIDRVEITTKAGDGGSGASSFRREKYVPRGGPDGGDGGKGGDVIFQADRSVRTLKEMGRRRMYRAESGQHGMGSDKHGRQGEDLVLRVPVGTQITRITEDGEELPAGDLLEQGQAIAVVRGGIGGWGNARFKTSVHRSPRIAQKGQAGEEARLRLDLKLLADVGLIGLPNAGKSTLLQAMSSARPRIGAYPFTTLEPNLGVVDVGWERFVAADIPGLIEGAHEGAGLGLEFLRHIERTRLLVHLLDGGSEEPLQDMRIVNAELKEYGDALAQRPQTVVINKTDIAEVAERIPALRKRFQKEGIEPMFMSAATGDGVPEVMERIARTLHEMEIEAAERAPVEEPEALMVLTPPAERKGAVTVSRENGAYRVVGDREVAFAEMMPLETDEGRAEFWRRLTRWGVVGALRRAGARPGDRVRLGKVDLELEA